MLSPKASLSPFLFFFFNDTATTEIYTLSLHDALPIYDKDFLNRFPFLAPAHQGLLQGHGDRKSTRLNSSHSQISYAVFCLKKKKKIHCATGGPHERQRGRPGVVGA